MCHSVTGHDRNSKANRHENAAGWGKKKEKKKGALDASPIGSLMLPSVFGLGLAVVRTMFLLSSTFLARFMRSMHKRMEDPMNYTPSPPPLDAIFSSSSGGCSRNHLSIDCTAGKKKGGKRKGREGGERDQSVNE